MVKLWHNLNSVIPSYIARNFKLWLSFALEKGYDIQEQDIIFVSGFVKVSEWAIAAFSTGGNYHEISFNGSFGAFASSAHFSASCRNDSTSTIHQRCGPSRPGVDATTTKDQCLFLSYYKLKSRGLPFSGKCIEVTSRDDVKGACGKFDRSHSYPVQTLPYTPGFLGRFRSWIGVSGRGRESSTNPARDEQSVVDNSASYRGLDHVPSEDYVSI